MSDNIKWEAPSNPDRGTSRGGSLWTARLSTVASRPGEWAKVHTTPKPHSARSAAWQARRDFPDFEFVSRRQPDGTGGIYARYVGGAA